MGVGRLHSSIRSFPGFFAHLPSFVSFFASVFSVSSKPASCRLFYSLFVIHLSLFGGVKGSGWSGPFQMIPSPVGLIAQLAANVHTKTLLKCRFFRVTALLKVEPSSQSEKEK